MRRRRSCKPRLATSTPSMSTVPLTPSSVRSRQLTKASVSALSRLSTATWTSHGNAATSKQHASYEKSSRNITIMLGFLFSFLFFFFLLFLGRSNKWVHVNWSGNITEWDPLLLISIFTIVCMLLNLLILYKFTN